MTIRAKILQTVLYAALKVSGWKKKVLWENLEYVSPGMSELQKKSFRKRLLKNISRDAADFITKSRIYSSKDSRFEIDPASLPVFKKMQKGGLMLTAHFGNYEIIGPWLVRMGIPLVASYAHLKPKILDNWVYSHIRSVDRYNYSLFINNPRDIIKVLDVNKLFCLIADQDYRESHFISGKLLGKPVHCNPIPQFILKHRPNTPIYICWLNSQNNKRILFAQEIITTNCEKIFDRYHIWLENQIKKSPEEWYGWIHRRYLSTMKSTNQSIYSIVR